METVQQRLAALGTAVPRILLPNPRIDLEAWAVIACDQFTQDRSYWDQVRERVAGAPSTLNMVFPEIYLEDPGRGERIAAIRQRMKATLEGGVFAEALQGIVYIERSTPQHPRRRGLVLALDLERYDWSPAARPLIRATEGTVQERIPPRMEIRRGAALESPHVIVLIDDDDRSLIEGLGLRAQKRPPRYDTPLMLGAGGVRGWVLQDGQDLAYLAAGLERLAAKARQRYGASDGEAFLYAVGDGNHSLATAKAVWDEYKAAHAAEEGIMDHPARWALVELENIYDEGIDFEPIHRVVFGADLDTLTRALSPLPGFRTRPVSGVEELTRLVAEDGAPGNRYGLISRSGLLLAETSVRGIATEGLQSLLDTLIADRRADGIDYLHGAAETVRVALADDSGAPRVGLLLPPVGKSDLFAGVARSGPLPRKSFSMGEAEEKRFYLECRLIFG